MCPLSNLRLCVVDDLSEHPLRAMLARGLAVTGNSDDPSYFGGYLNDNYRAIAAALGLERSHLVRLARNSFEAAFLDPAETRRLVARVDRYAEEWGVSV